MKKRIKKREYNTETAERVAEFNSHQLKEILYRKNTGEFFLHKSGDAEDIFPMSYDEAQAWSEEHISAKEVDKIFGEIKDKEKTAKIFSLSKAATEKLKKEAAKENVSMSEVLERLVLENIK